MQAGLRVSCVQCVSPLVLLVRTQLVKTQHIVVACLFVGWLVVGYTILTRSGLVMFAATSMQYGLFSLSGLCVGLDAAAASWQCRSSIDLICSLNASIRLGSPLLEGSTPQPAHPHVSRIMLSTCQGSACIAVDVLQQKLSAGRCPGNTLRRCALSDQPFDLLITCTSCNSSGGGGTVSIWRAGAHQLLNMQGGSIQ